jgi:ABC-type uncharacterized transport system permease subunit
VAPDRIALIVATLFFLGGFAYSTYALGARRYRSARLNLALMVLGFAGQSVFLYLRGQAVGRCPITSAFEVIIFVSWSVVLLYLLVGPAFHLSLLGVFTAPLVFVFHLAALLMPERATAAVPSAGGVDFWLEVHASVSLVAYGAFALAGVAGTMYLVQDWLLKTHRTNLLFYELPPVAHLGKATLRLMVLGFGLLSVGIVSAHRMEAQPEPLKLWLSYAIWAVYGLVIASAFWKGSTNKRVARAAVGAFVLPVLTLWIVAT